MFYLLKGIPFIYQGQEFGSANSRYDDISFFNDVETLNYYKENVDKKPLSQLIDEINYGSRDNTRRPLAWTEEKNTHGFTNGTPWLTMPSRADEINLEKDKKSNKSIFGFYKKVLELRNSSNTIKYGTFKDLTLTDGCFVYERQLGQDKIIVAVNFEKQNTISLPDCITKTKAEVLLCNYSTGNLNAETFDNVFNPYEIRVYKVK